MHKATPQNLLSLLTAIVCAVPLSAVLAKSGPSALVVALLSVAVTVLLLQVALRRDLSSLKDSMRDEKKN